MKTSFRPFKEISNITAEAQWQLYAAAARRFALVWAHEIEEKGEAYSFWDEFLLNFNIRRRYFARHEIRAKHTDNRRGFIDLFWPGKLLVEHKASHKNKAEDFDEALRQAIDYIGDMDAKDRPQKLIGCNFRQFRVYDMETMTPTTHTIAQSDNFGSMPSLFFFVGFLESFVSFTVTDY